MQLKIQIFNHFDESLKKLWVNFQQSTDSYIFQTYEWQEYWFQTIGISLYSKPFIIAVYDGSKLIAIFPLGVRVSFGVNIVEFLGGGQNDYNNPIFANDFSFNSFEKIWELILRAIPKYDVVNLCRIPEKLQNHKNYFLKTLLFENSGESHYAELPDSINKISEIASKRTLKDNRRMRRRLSEMGDLKFMVAVNALEYNSIVTDTLKQKQARYLSTGAINILRHKNVYSFYNDLFNNIPCVHLSALKLDKKILATHLGIVFRKRFYYLMPTFLAGNYEKYSPGRLLLEDLMQWSIDNNLEVYDFTTGSENYKEKWCNKKMNIYNYQTYSTLKGFIFVIILKVILYLKSNPSIRPFLMKLNRLRKG